MFQFLQALAPLAKGIGTAGQAAGGMFAGLGANAAPQMGGMFAAGAPAAAKAAASAAAPAASGLGGWLSNISNPTRGQQLIDLASAMLQAGAPSTDPRSGDFFNALGAGLGAYSQSGRQSQDDAVKQAYTNAMIGNTNASADSTRASAELTRSQAAAAAEGMPLYAGAGAAALPAAQPGQAILPQAGTVVDGYRFRGGNPNDPANWEVAQ